MLIKGGWHDRRVNLVLRSQEIRVLQKHSSAVSADGAAGCGRYHAARL